MNTWQGCAVLFVPSFVFCLFVFLRCVCVWMCVCVHEYLVCVHVHVCFRCVLYVCVCVYVLSPTDRDECVLSHSCMHGCVNTDGSYYCECNQGYRLASNNHSCVGKSRSRPLCVCIQSDICVCACVCGSNTIPITSGVTKDYRSHTLDDL